MGGRRRRPARRTAPCARQTRTAELPPRRWPCHPAPVAKRVLRAVGQAYRSRVPWLPTHPRPRRSCCRHRTVASGSRRRGFRGRVRPAQIRRAARLPHAVTGASRTQQRTGGHKLKITSVDSSGSFGMAGVCGASARPWVARRGAAGAPAYLRSATGDTRERHINFPRRPHEPDRPPPSSRDRPLPPRHRPVIPPDQ